MSILLLSLVLGADIGSPLPAIVERRLATVETEVAALRIDVEALKRASIGFSKAGKPGPTCTTNRDGSCSGSTPYCTCGNAVCRCNGLKSSTAGRPRFFTADWCTYCPAIDRVITEAGYDVERLPPAPGMTIPRVEWNGQAVVGNDPAAVLALLGGQSNGVTFASSQTPVMQSTTVEYIEAPTKFRTKRTKRKLFGGNGGGCASCGG